MEPAERNLHRNNAAEWLMWVCLLPAYLVLRMLRACGLKKD